MAITVVKTILLILFINLYAIFRLLPGQSKLRDRRIREYDVISRNHQPHHSFSVRD